MSGAPDGSFVVCFRQRVGRACTAKRVANEWPKDGSQRYARAVSRLVNVVIHRHP